jgi:hypothetical protein
MGGEADEHIRPHQGAHFGHGQVFLAHMHAVGLGQDGQVHIVVHDEAGVGLAGQAAEQAAFFQHGSGFELFFAVLHDAHTGAEQGADHFFQGAPRE